MIDTRRSQFIRQGEPGEGAIAYIMSRDQRVDDNWALLYAQEIAIERRQPLVVVLPLAADYPEAPQRQRQFMLEGIKSVDERLGALKIPLLVCEREAVSTLTKLARSLPIGAFVVDFNPLKESRRWKTELAGQVMVPMVEVDAHNVVPVWETSDKQQYAAYTIRPRIHKKLPDFLTPFPQVIKHPISCDLPTTSDDWLTITELKSATTVGAIDSLFVPGETEAKRRMSDFLLHRLNQYNDARNNPVANGQSGLSPYFHFGQLSAQRVALEAQRFDDSLASQESFLEELIVRRELSDNFCYYNQQYDSFAGFPSWAQTTLDQHRLDPRPHLYTESVLESAETHDELWNAAQKEMVITGKMHGYMRMYWAKKILEWSPSPEEALARAIKLNNSYELDGHDPNGYVGVAWSVGGVHDRAWSEREIFGKIRYMSYGGCKRKFPVDQYVNHVSSLKVGKAG